MALRYALGRNTYVESYVPELILNNKNYLDKRVCNAMINDIDSYLQNKKNYNKVEDNNWLNFKAKLLDVFELDSTENV